VRERERVRAEAIEGNITGAGRGQKEAAAAADDDDDEVGNKSVAAAGHDSESALPRLEQQ